MLSPSELGREIHTALWQHLETWYPRAISAAGGFHQSFSATWDLVPSSNRFVVNQARHLWVTAAVLHERKAELDEAQKAKFRSYVDHGLELFQNQFVVPESGLVRWAVDVERENPINVSEEFHVYGSAFALYALAATARIAPETNALALAMSVFRAIEDRFVDQEHGGYVEVVNLDGDQISETPAVPATRWESRQQDRDGLGTPYGQKSQNSHLHLLEAYAEFARVTDSPEVRRALRRLLSDLLGRFWVEEGWLHQFLERDGTPVPMGISHGHDIEAAHLLRDAADVLGLSSDLEIQRKTERLVHFALEHAWDAEAGGLFLWGDVTGKPQTNWKNWWTQAESLLALARFWHDSGRDDLYAKLVNQWIWIRDHQIDTVNGGWFEEVTPNGVPEKLSAKATPWKVSYHDGRALMFALRYLE